MEEFYAHSSSSSSLIFRNQMRDTDDFGQLVGTFGHNDGVDLGPNCSIFSLKSTNDMPIFLPNNTSNNAMPFNVDVANKPILEKTDNAECLAYDQQYNQKQINGQFESSTEDVSVDKTSVHHNDKTLRRLAQNREAAKKSRLRKKAYVEQLESSRVRLAELEQELQQQQVGAIMGAGAFDVEYARWVEEHQRLMNGLRSGAISGDTELSAMVEAAMGHYDEMFRLKAMGAKADVFHILSGMWKTPVERCLMWMGGFRCSELLKMIGAHLELELDLMAEEQLGHLQQSSQQAEDALSQGMEALQQSLAESLLSTPPTADYMAHMGTAITKLATLQNFLHQADLLRRQTLHQLHRILTAPQAARALLLINDYFLRLRALSSLWLARPRDSAGF